MRRCRFETQSIDRHEFVGYGYEDCVFKVNFGNEGPFAIKIVRISHSSPNIVPQGRVWRLASCRNAPPVPGRDLYRLTGSKFWHSLPHSTPGGTGPSWPFRDECRNVAITDKIRWAVERSEEPITIRREPSNPTEALKNL